MLSACGSSGADASEEGRTADAAGCGDGLWRTGGQCLPWRDCGPGEYVSAEGTGLYDRACRECPSATFSTVANAAACEPWTHCEAGEFVAAAGSNRTDRQCAPCAEGKFSAAADAVSCSAWQRCTAPAMEVTPGTALADAVCVAPSMDRISWAMDGVDVEATAPRLSPDGRRVAFVAVRASNFSVFLRDIETGDTQPVSIATDGSEANDDSTAPALSADGRYVAFQSTATNLVADDTNGVSDIFVHDLQAGETRRVSTSLAGAQRDEKAESPGISADGRYIVYTGYSSTTLPGGYEQTSNDVFLHDLTTGETRLVSLDANGEPFANGAFQPSLSADGRYVAFAADGIWIRDLQLGQTQRADGGLDGADQPMISGDGRYVAFRSEGPDYPYSRIYVADLLTGTQRVLSSAQSYGYDPCISADGRFIAFESLSPDRLASNSPGQIVVYDRQSDVAALASSDANGVGATSSAAHPTLSADGRRLAFSSAAGGLVDGDSNHLTDVFVVTYPQH